jgi:hypothetical protein
MKHRPWRWDRSQARTSLIAGRPIMVVPGWPGRAQDIITGRRFADGPLDSDTNLVQGGGANFLGELPQYLTNGIIGNGHRPHFASQQVSGLKAITAMTLVSFNSVPTSTFLGLLQLNRVAGGSSFKLCTGSVASHFTFIINDGTGDHGSGDGTFTITSGPAIWAVGRWASGAGPQIDVFDVNGVKQAGGVTGSVITGSLAGDAGTPIWGGPVWMWVGYVFPRSLSDAEVTVLAHAPMAYLRPWRPTRFGTPPFGGSLPIGGGLGGPAAFMMLGGGPAL